MAENGRLSSKQSALLLALVSGQKLEEAATASGVAKRTAYRWQKLDSFQAALKQAKDDAFVGHLALFKQGLVTAMLTLQRNMRPEAPPAVQVAAAARWIETTLMIYHTEELETSIAELQAVLKGSYVPLR
jgi:hypothetical protein